MSATRVVAIVLCLAFTLILLGAHVASAEVPKRINYQGRITDGDTGEPLPGSHDMVFRIYDVESNGSWLWSESHSVIADTAGVVSAILGSTTPIGVSFDGAMWLEVEVDTEVLAPRREIVSVPYAFRSMDSDHAGDADSLGGTYSGDYVVEGEVGVISSDMIVDGSGSGLDADMLDGLNGDAYADSGHNHDDRYYLQDELDTAGSINDAGNPVDWTKLKNVPAGFADGTDDIGGSGDGHSLDAADGSPVDAVYVDNDGDVGIGTTAPYAQVEVVGSTNSDALFRSVRNGGATVSFGAELSAGTIGTNSNHPMIFRTTMADRMYIGADGSLGIGTTNPDRLLHVFNGSAGAVTPQAEADVVIEDNGHTLINFLSPNTATQGIHFGDVNDSAEGWILYHHADNKLEFGTVDNDRMTIDSNGNVGIGTDSPASDVEVVADIWQDILAVRLASTSNRLCLQSGGSWASLCGGTGYRNDIAIEHATGFVGIGTGTPDDNLHVVGTTRVEGDDSAVMSRFKNTNSSGAAILAAGNNLTGYYPTLGCGVAATGDYFGMYARASRTGDVGKCAIWTELAQTGTSVRVNYQKSDGTLYKIYGSGLVATVMSTAAGKKTLMCPESPEAWIEDYGSGKIASGLCHVELDPLLLDCVTVNEEHPLKVLVTLTSPIANQFYVKKGLTGFDLIVVGEGAETVSGTFDYKVVGKWKDYEHLRFADYEEPPEAVQVIEPERKAVGPEANM